MGFDLFPFFDAFAPDAASAADAVTVHNCWRYRRMPGFEPDILRPQTGVLPMRYTLTYPYILFILKVFDASVQFLELKNHATSSVEKFSQQDVRRKLSKEKFFNKILIYSLWLSPIVKCMVFYLHTLSL